MQYLHDTNKIQLNKDTVVTLGKFDGVHIGHQKLIRILKEKAAEYNASSVMFTFDHMPVSLSQNTGQQSIMTNLERRRFIKNQGIDILIEYPFTNEFMNMEATEFLENVLLKQLKAKCIVVGTDCTFGKDKHGDARMLVDKASELGYEVIVADKEMWDDKEISSTLVRAELEVGHMETVNMLLGRPFSVSGVVAGGNKLGRTMSIPTINIYPPSMKLLPPFGVYASITTLGEKEYHGVTNVGVKPTVQNNSEISVETFLFDVDVDAYDCDVDVKLIHFQRPEMKFDNMETLQKQMEADLGFAKELFLL